MKIPLKPFSPLIFSYPPTANHPKTACPFIMFQQTVAQRDTIQQEPGAPVHLSSKTKETDTPFPFMKLPIELRRQVYRQLLVSDEDYLGMMFPRNTLYPNMPPGPQ